MSETVRLYHYCCQHSARAITRRGMLTPHGRDFFGVDLVWLTTEQVPDREGLGLTSHLTGLSCDRLEYQYIVDAPIADVEPWLSSDIRAKLQREPFYSYF